MPATVAILVVEETIDAIWPSSAANPPCAERQYAKEVLYAFWKVGQNQPLAKEALSTFSSMYVWAREDRVRDEALESRRNGAGRCPRNLASIPGSVDTRTASNEG